MKAWVLREIGEICFEEAGRPVPKDDEVLVEVKAAGICGSDIPRIYKTGAYTHPLIPGHEFSGQVVQTGKDVDKKWLDRRVGVFPLIPCKRCAACRERQYELCRGYSYLGSRRNGGFAEYVAVPAWNLIAIPDNVSYTQAAMMEPMAVAVHAMRNASLKDADKSKTIAVCGFGTIGMLLVMFLKEAGYTNIHVIGNKDFQREKAVSAGIDDNHFYDNRNNKALEWLTDQTDGSGVDVFFECVGRNETAALAVMAAAPNGIVQLVGNPASDILFEKNIYWTILRNQLVVKGTWNSSFTHSTEDDWSYVLERLQGKTVYPEQCVTHCLTLDNLEKGLLIMRDKTQEYLKVMIERSN